MHIIYQLAFLLLFPFLFSCNQAVEIPKSAHLPNKMQIQTDSQRTQKGDDNATNIVFKSTDGGQTWQNISDGLPQPMPDEYTVGSNVFFADDNGLWITARNGLYQSNPHSTASFWSPAIFPGEHSSIAPGKAGIYAYNYGSTGIFQKTNGTGGWSPVFTNFKEKQIFSVFETAGGTIFISSDRGLFKSTDSGKSWKYIGVMGEKLAEWNGVLMATNDRGIIRSTDDGENWAVVLSEGGVGIDVERIQGGFAAITYSTVSKTRRIRTSCDGGKTWQAIDAGFQPNGLTDAILPPVNAALTAQSFSDSMQYPKDAAALPVPTYTTTIVQVGENFFCGRSDGIYRSSDKGKTWQCVRCVKEGKMFRLFVSGNVIYAIQVAAHC